MLLTAALAYARHGIPVLPVHTPAADGGCSCGRFACERAGKHPRLRHGLTEASTDPRRIEMWWARWPDAGVGLRTGVVMDVADIDSAEGWHGLRHLLGGAMPTGPQVRTGGGGWHFWFRPTGYGNRVGLIRGVDWRGDGGYVVAPPSRHAAGAEYRWLVRPRDEPAPPNERQPGNEHQDEPAPPNERQPGNEAQDEPAPPSGHPPRDEPASEPWLGRRGDLPSAPSALIDLIAGPPFEPPATAIVHPDRYAAVALEAEADRVARAPVGTRNDTLNRAAFALGRLVGAGMLDGWLVTQVLTDAARQAGLDRAEIRGTIRSGLTAGRRQPLDTTRRVA